MKSRFAVPAALVFFCTLWRVPLLGDPPWLNDEGTYANVGKAIFSGEALYRQVWENKPPAIYLLYGAVHALVGSAHLLVGVRLLALLAALVTQVSLYWLVRQAGRPAVALLATAVAGVALDLPLLDGTSANAEIFLGAATTLGMALLWRARGVGETRGAERTEVRARSAMRPPGINPGASGKGSPARFAGVSPGASGEMLNARAPGMNLGASGHEPHGRKYAILVIGSGLAFGVAIMFKLVAGADSLAAIAVILALASRRRRGAMALFLGGLAVPPAIVLLWLAKQGLVGDAVYATIGYNLGYVATGQGTEGLLLSIALLAVPLALLLIGAWVWHTSASTHASGGAGVSPALVAAEVDDPGSAGILPAPRREAGGASAGERTDPARAGDGGAQDARGAGPSITSGFTAASLWWLGMALLGALASGRSYPHYYLEAVPPGAICIALLVARLGAVPDRWARRTLVGLLVIWSICVPLISWQAVAATRLSDPPGSRVYGYLGYAWQHLTGSLNDAAYGDRIDPRVERNVAVAQYLQDHPVQPLRLYVWGNAPWVYYLSGYEHAARFLSAYYRPAIPGGMDQTLAGLRADPPPYIVVVEPPLPADVALAAFVHARYTQVWRYQKSIVYKLRP
jgi:hypothetical protein